MTELVWCARLIILYAYPAAPGLVSRGEGEGRRVRGEVLESNSQNEAVAIDWEVCNNKMKMG